MNGSLDQDAVSDNVPGMAQGGGVFLECAANSKWALAKESLNGAVLEFEGEQGTWKFLGIVSGPSDGFPAGTYHQLTPDLAAISIISSASGRDTAGVFTTLTDYFTGIDAHQYQRAYAQLGSAEQSLFSEQSLAANDSTTFVDDVHLDRVTPQGSGKAQVDVDFTSQQTAAKGPNGDTCDQWTLQYTMQRVGAGWVIAKTSGQNGSTHESC